jgi:hypothetical protein
MRAPLATVVLLSTMLAASTAPAREDGPLVLRVAKNDTVRELRLWPKGEDRLRFELTVLRGGDPHQYEQSGVAVLAPAEDAASITDERGATFPVREYSSHPRGCWIDIRLDAANRDWAKVNVSNCPIAVLFQTDSTYRKAE